MRTFMGGVLERLARWAPWRQEPSSPPGGSGTGRPPSIKTVSTPGSAGTLAVSRVRPRDLTEHRLGLRRLEQFLDTEVPEVRWWVDEMVPVDGFVALIGPEKSGKSLLSAQLALAIASGTPFLGQATQQGTVMLVEEEGTPASMVRRLQTQVSALGLSRNLPLYPDARPGLALHTAQGKDRLYEGVARRKPDILIVGPLAQLFALEDENSAAEMGKVIAALHGLMREFPTTVVLAHHLKKDAPLSRTTAFFHGSRGSNALTAAVDAGIGLARRADRPAGHLVFLLRDGLRDTMDITFERDGLLFRPAAAGEVSAGVSHPADERCRAILAALKARPGLSRDQLSGPSTGGVGTVRRHMLALEDAGLVVSDGGRPEMYSLVESRDAAA